MQSQGKIVEILARFPGPVTLYPSRRKWIRILLLSATFVAVGLWMISHDNAYGWAGLVFFGLGMVVAIIALLPGAGKLKLDRDGFEITNLFRHQSLRWQDTTGFEAAIIPPSSLEMVVFDDANAKGKTLASLSLGLVGHNAGLPDTFGLQAKDLASLMAQWREYAIPQR